jgi:hypothetical protein
MSYIAPTSLSFNLKRDYVAPIGDALAFNLGVDAGASDIEGAIAYTLDNCAGSFTGFVPRKSIGTLSATLDNCVGAVSAAWLVQPKSLIVSTVFHVKHSEKLELRIASLSNTAETLALGTQSTQQRALKLAQRVGTKTQKAAKLARRVKNASQKAKAITKKQACHVTDLHTYTHKFDTQFFKEPPEKYRYTPSAVFDFKITLNERAFNVVTNEYIAANPVYFNLIEIISTELNFDLSESFTIPITRTRQIFDNISTYQPVAEFFASWANDNLTFNHSYERAALRIGVTNHIERADIITQRYDEKNQAALKVALRFKQSQRNAQKLARNVQSKIQNAAKLARRYRELVQNALTIWNSNKSIIPVDPPRPIYIPPSINHVTTIIPQKQVYSMQHSISVTLENLTPISVDAVKLALDNDSFAWSFSANLLDLSQLNLVQQTDNTPVILVITIDGNVFKMLVEKITRNRSFAKNSISLSGRSLSALLSQPYQQPRSATQSSLMTVQQLAELELPNGWTINWTASSWNVTSGAWSYTAKTPIQVITEIAANIGAIVVPSRNAKVLNIMPRYTVLPWLFDATTPDVIIPDSAIVSLSYRNIVPTQANGVYIHGGEVGGVLSRCRLSGTAGDRLSATVTNPLMTDVIGTRALAETILANAYEQPAIQSVSLKLGSDYPLIGIGDFVRINIDGGHVFGVVNSVSIDAALDSVDQVIQIGNESANIWTAFKEILPSQPLLVGTVASVSGETSLMTLIDGGVVRVRGVGAVGEKWYLKAGTLDSKAPALTLNEVVI